MTLTHNEIISIMKLFRESRFNNLHFEGGDFKLVISKDGQALVSPEQSSPIGGPSVGAQQLPGDGVTVEQGPASDPAQADLDYEQIKRDGLEVFTSPMLGVFYRAPKPGEAPFVEEGAWVDSGATLCIIEVMKLYTSITADQQGAIVKICAEDGQLVEYGQPLFLIKLQPDPHGK